MPPSKSRDDKLRFCTCDLYCFGGQWISRSSRHRHAKDSIIRKESKCLDIITRQASSRGVDGPIDVFLNKLTQLEDEIVRLKTLSSSISMESLVFKAAPTTNAPYLRPALEEILKFNEGRYSWDNSDRKNGLFLYVERHYQSCWLFLHDKQSYLGTAHIQNLVLHGIYALHTLKEKAWLHQAPVAGPNPNVVHTDIFFNQQAKFRQLAPVICTACLTTTVLETLFFSTRRALRAHLGGVRDILIRNGIAKDDLCSLPKDPRTCRTLLNIDPKVHRYICCPRCHALYPESLAPPTFSACTNKATPDSPACGEPLWREKNITAVKKRQIPVKTYDHQDLKHWIGRMLSRKEIETQLQQEWINIPDGKLSDVWGSPGFLQMMDHTGRPFYPGTNEEGRLVFSLSVDGFNPFGNKTAKQIATSTGIWMVLLNLPEHLRHLLENIYVAGIIPGPTKPSIDQINNYIQLVVDDLKELWDPGVFYSRTSLYSSGRLIRAMLSLLVCDMLGARQVAGYVNSTNAHHMCMFCDLDKDDISLTDRQQWPRKDLQTVRFFSGLWKNATTSQNRDIVFNASGWRWSPLLELQYWDPLVYTGIDTMHCLDLNLLPHHCRSLFGINLTRPGGNRAAASPTTQKPLMSGNKVKLEQILRLIQRKDDKLYFRLLEHDRIELYTICALYNIRKDGVENIMGNRLILAENIVCWRNKMIDTSLLDELPQMQTVGYDHNPGEAEIEEDDGGTLSSENPAKKIRDRIIKLLLSVEDQERCRKLAYNKATVVIYKEILSLLEVDPTEYPTKISLYIALLSLIDDPYHRAWLEDMISVDMTPNAGAVLGHDIMLQIWTDMTRSQLPSWINAAPRDWGTKRRGKLSANNWRVICTIHIPITLIWMWRNETGRKRDLLNNFMDLVTAVRLANSRISSLEQIAAYEMRITRYVQDIQRLYPGVHLRPTHHAALHVGEVMTRFGPNHSHRSEFYERYINLLHRMNINQHFGELESTLLRTSARRAALMSVLSENHDIRSDIDGMLRTMENIEREDLRGHKLENIIELQTLMEETGTGRQVILSRECTEIELKPPLDEVFRKFCHERQLTQGRMNVLSFDRVSIGNIVYGTSTSTRFRDSAVIYKLPGEEKEVAGIISLIFQYNHHPKDYGIAGEKGLFAVIRGYKQIDSQRLVDPYLLYGSAGGFLCDKKPESIHIVQFGQIISHAVITSFPELHMTHIMLVNKTFFDCPTQASPC